MRRIVLAIALLSSITACPSSGSRGPDADVLPGDKFPLMWGPVTVQPSQESTQCIWVRLGNDNAIKVPQIHNVLSTSSHHLIVYKDDMDTVEQTTPYDCQPFTGALNLSGTVAPIMITQKKDDPLTLPDGVAYTLAAHQMMRIEMHYINATDATITATATSDFYAAPEGSVHDEASILFIGSPDINLAPGTTTTVEEFFTPMRASLDLSGAKFFAITGHTHHLGTDMQVSTRETSAGVDTMVYQPVPFTWSEPLTEVHSPEFTVPQGGGLNFKCTYNNTTAATVKFGESANNEMCFFWAYYYPSKGSHVCVHTTQYGGLDICCPDAGAQLCNMLNKN